MDKVSNMHFILLNRSYGLSVSISIRINKVICGGQETNICVCVQCRRFFGLLVWPLCLLVFPIQLQRLICNFSPGRGHLCIAPTRHLSIVPTSIFATCLSSWLVLFGKDKKKSKVSICADIIADVFTTLLTLEFVSTKMTAKRGCQSYCVSYRCDTPL